MKNIQLLNAGGHRLYLNEAEREAFLASALQQPPYVMTFCLFLYYTGCRLSEALGRYQSDFDEEERKVIIRSLKKRDAYHFRTMPLPENYLEKVQKIHAHPKFEQEKLWNWSRVTGWRRVKEVMNEAGITGANSSPKALRHGFAVSCVMKGIPITTLQKWLGHSDLKTTAIYTNVSGPEERSLISLTW